MSTPIPSSLRAAAGLAAVALDSARKVPQQLVGLPVLAVSTALQASLKAQQAYAGLVARGDEVLGQLRGEEDAPPWARFDDDSDPARPRSAFDAVPDTDLDDLAAEVGPDGAAAADLEGLADLADLVAAELAAEADRGLDPDLEPDVLTVAAAVEVETELLAAPGLTEADAGGADVGELDLDPDDVAAADDGELAEVIAIDPTGTGLNGQRPDGSGTEPGADLPAEGAALAADAAATGAALAADVIVPAADGTVGPGGLDGYLAVEPPVPGYDDLSIPQLRGRLRALSLEQVEALVGYERTHRARPPYLTMLENRITTLRSR